MTTPLISIARTSAVNDRLITRGNLKLSWSDFTCATLELPWKNNERSISCIPTGDYKVYLRDYGRYQKAFHKRWGHLYSLGISGVEGRTSILFHPGNYVGHSKGCILPGLRYNDDATRIVASRSAYKELYENIIEAFSQHNHEVGLQIFPHCTINCETDEDERDITNCDREAGDL